MSLSHASSLATSNLSAVIKTEPNVEMETKQSELLQLLQEHPFTCDVENLSLFSDALAQLPEWNIETTRFAVINDDFNHEVFKSPSADDILILLYVQGRITQSQFINAFAIVSIHGLFKINCIEGGDIAIPCDGCRVVNLKNESQLELRQALVAHSNSSLPHVAARLNFEKALMDPKEQEFYACVIDLVYRLDAQHNSDENTPILECIIYFEKTQCCGVFQLQQAGGTKWTRYSLVVLLPNSIDVALTCSEQRKTEIVPTLKWGDADNLKKLRRMHQQPILITSAHLKNHWYLPKGSRGNAFVALYNDLQLQVYSSITPTSVRLNLLAIDDALGTLFSQINECSEPASNSLFQKWITRYSALPPQAENHKLQTLFCGLNEASVPCWHQAREYLRQYHKAKLTSRQLVSQFYVGASPRDIYKEQAEHHSFLFSRELYSSFIRYCLVHELSLIHPNALEALKIMSEIGEEMSNIEPLEAQGAEIVVELIDYMVCILKAQKGRPS